VVQLLIALALVALAIGARAAEIGERHTLDWRLDLGYASPVTDLRAWPEGGAGKLRFDDDDHRFGDLRLTAEYRGRITNTLWVNAIAQASEGSPELGLTEAYLDWRPVPRSMSEFRVRAGAFYPPFSLENGGPAWTSPFTTSFSAINAWLGEEIRPIGAELRVNRSLGRAGSRQELSLFAAGFYGNDPAGTLLFWRGFALHDRQTRLNEHLALPSLAIFDAEGNVVGHVERRLDPIAETDHEPGFYAGLEWRLRRRVSLQLARYDNRADPESFRNGQWGWDTRFWHLSAQVELKGDFGLVTQWMHGSTGWLVATTEDGQRTPATRYVDDEFDSRFVLLTKRLGRHRLSVRQDEFTFRRPDGLNIDSGDATTLAYAYAARPNLMVAAEWLSIESTRDLWPRFYGVSASHRERQIELSVTLTR